MTYCDEYVELISAAIDGALSPDQQARLEEHLNACPECRALYDDLNAVHRALRELPPVEVPAGLTGRILEAVAAEAADNVVALPKAKRPAPRPWRSLATAAVLVLVLAGAWGMSQGFDQARKSAPEAMARGAMAPLPESADADTVFQYPVPGDAPQSSEDEFSLKLAREPAVGQNASPVDQPDEVSTDTQDPGTMTVDVSAIMEGVMDPEATIDVTGSLFVLPTAPEGVDMEIPAEGPDEEPGEALPLTREEALSLLVEFLWSEEMPEGMQKVDTEEFFGYATPLVSQDGDPRSQQVSIRLEYLGLTSNGKYHEFWLYSFLLDEPETGLAHSSTLNFFAVPLDGGDILVQRIDMPDDSDESMELYLAGIDAYHEAISN